MPRGSALRSLPQTVTGLDALATLTITANGGNTVALGASTDLTRCCGPDSVLLTSNFSDTISLVTNTIYTIKLDADANVTATGGTVSASAFVDPVLLFLLTTLTRLVTRWISAPTW
jgi:hypothetical protein